MTAVMDRQSLHLMSNNGMLEVIHRVNDTDAYYIAERHQLGSGTTANVKRCWKRIGAGLVPMAAKVANGNGLSNEYVAFEADALQHLQGVPGVVQLVGSGTSHGCEFVVMDLVPGVSLAQAGTQLSNLPNRGLWLQNVALQLLQAMYEVHARGVAWRDGSLSNVLVHTDSTGTPLVTIIDFGGCKAFGPDELLWLHEVGFFATPQFASPELVNLWSLSHSGQRKVPHILYNAVKADSWSVGAILFELAAGEGLVQAGPGFDRAAVIGMSADVTLWWLETIHNCHTLREDNQAWQDEMHAKLVMGSGSSDFADLICHLLDYNVQGRWTPAQALQEVCVQNINAACGYPSLLVPMPAAVQNSCIPMGNLSSQASHAGSFFSSALVKSLSFDGPAQLAVVDNSPRIATAPASNAFQYGTDRDFVTEGSATTQWQLASLLPPDVSPRSGGAVSGAHHSLAVGGSLHSNIAAITPAVSNLTADLPARYNVDSPHLQPYHSHSIDASPALPSTAGFWQVPDREIPAAYHVPDSFGQFPGQGFDPSAAIHSDAGHQGASNAWTVDSQNSTDEATAMLPADLFDDDLTYAEPDAAVAFLPSDLLDLDEETEAEQALLSRAHDEADDQSALLDQGNAPQAETAQLVDDSAQPLQPYGVTGLEASVDLLGVYSRVNNTFICKLAVGNVSRKTALYNYDSDGSSSSSSSCSSNSSSSGSGGAETVRQQTGVCGSDDTGSEALSLLGSLDSDNNSGSSMQAGTVPVIPPFAEDDDALSSNYSSDISQLGVESGSVTHQAELYVDTESEGEQMTVALPFREGHPLSGYDLDCVNSHISATKLLTQSCPELLAGPTEFALTAEHQYSITRLPCEALTLHELMSQQQEVQKGSLQKGLGLPFVQEVACKLLQALALLHEQGHCLGAIIPQRVLVQPCICLMDYSIGAIRFDPISMEYTSVDTLLSMWDGYHPGECCTAAGDMHSLGVLLYKIATGSVPFPLTYQPHQAFLTAEGNFVGWLMDEAEAHHDKWKAVHWWPYNAIRKKLPACVDRPTAQLILSLLHPEAFKRPSAVEALQLPCLQQMMAPTVVPRPALILAAEGTTEAAVAATAMHDSVADATGGEHAVHALSSDSAHDAATEVIAQPAPGSAAADADPPAEAFARAAEPTSALDAGAVLEGEDEASNGPEEPPFWARAMCRTAKAAGWLAGTMVKNVQANPALVAGACVIGLGACRGH